jgi:hypothetical protein
MLTFIFNEIQIKKLTWNKPAREKEEPFKNRHTFERKYEKMQHIWHFFLNNQAKRD